MGVSKRRTIILECKMVLQLLVLLPVVLCLPSTRVKAPEGPQGPPGAVFKRDLLENNFPGATYGAFQAISAVPCQHSNMSCSHNNEMQTYRPESASQAGNGEITIKAERHSDGWITSARLESYQLWTTAISTGDIWKYAPPSLQGQTVDNTKAPGQLSGCWGMVTELAGQHMERLILWKW